MKTADGGDGNGGMNALSAKGLSQVFRYENLIILNGKLQLKVNDIKTQFHNLL